MVKMDCDPTLAQRLRKLVWLTQGNALLFEEYRDARRLNLVAELKGNLEEIAKIADILLDIEEEEKKLLQGFCYQPPKREGKDASKSRGSRKNNRASPKAAG